MRRKDLTEFELIDRIARHPLARETGVIRGIGDDCAVFRPPTGIVILYTTDMLVENVHFHRDRTPAVRLGRKALAVNLSDVAAMGGTPREALVSIAVPPGVTVEYLDGVYEGLRSMATPFGVNLLGGDTTSSPAHLVISVALTGEAAEDEVLFRSGALPGDLIFVAGPVGASAAGLDVLLHGRECDDREALVAAHQDPWPQVEAGRALARTRVVHALIDVSDGIAGDLGHVCQQSGTGAALEEERIPAAQGVRPYCERHGLDLRRLTLHTGEDYVLLGTVAGADARVVEDALRGAGCGYFPIGRIEREPGLRLKAADGSLLPLDPRGWDHFRSG